MTGFEDHFSKHAGDYARFRPHYPEELYDHLASISPGRRLAWDCGTGNGQAALALAERFDRVIATDPSAEQIAQAVPHERIEYRVERAEAVTLDPRSVDLVTAATAVHWFDLEPFYESVRRVLVPGGILAVWTYHLPEVEPAIDRVLERYYRDVLAGYWPERIRYLDERYETLPFPFETLQPPDFFAQADWDLGRLGGFLDSWSGTRRYLEERGQHPLGVIWPELEGAWGAPDRQRIVRWPLHLKVGRIGD